jgi:hypothetical protein
MLPDSLTNPVVADRKRLLLLNAERQTIRLLLYTDDPRIITTNIDDQMGLTTMIKHLKAHEPAFAKIEVELVSRSSNSQIHADNKLDAERLQKYDEVWFFGVHQVSRDNFTLGVLRGGPQSDLQTGEVSELAAWMKVEGEKGKGGGVLMTGDHANPRPPDAHPFDDDEAGKKEDFLGLGRALGRRVPRAGQLRKWEGAPTAYEENSFNTQVEVASININSLQLQLDSTPQQLILQTFDDKGNPATGGQPHPLFFYKEGAFIQIFPDHAHEGAVVLPPNLDDTNMWPVGTAIQPQPRVVAQSIDKRNSRLLNILAAYNGDNANVGRVVADSSWHHYLDVNLLNFPPDPQQDSVADQIGQFYGNLAMWLAPISVRRKMADAMFEWLANHPLMIEEVGGDSLEIGKKAYAILSLVASPCEIHELLQTAVPDSSRAKFETIYLPERGFALSPFPSKEVFLGSLIDSRQQSMIKAESSGGQAVPLAASATVSPFKSALKKHVTQIAQVTSEAKNL